MDISAGLPSVCQYPFCARKPQTADNTLDALAITSWYAVGFVCHKKKSPLLLPAYQELQVFCIPAFYAGIYNCRLGLSYLVPQLQDSVLVFTETIKSLSAHFVSLSNSLKSSIPANQYIPLLPTV